ncbi:MAG: hypothetical protein HY443_01450 [Candidatus Nealsonbacteria bacterium]|nr:hypothetical protein [Candidatus Nealsonbacteria bacterium]
MPKIILKGIPASPGRVTGKVKIIDPSRTIPKFSGQDIIVSSFLTPPFVALIKKNPAILGIITDGGGATCHAAIVARELRIPYIAGAIVATKKLRNNAEITTDSAQGLVYEES